VKASDWADLCNREHERGGEVIAVTLTRQSMQDLAGDMLSAASLVEPQAGACGARIVAMFNEAAGSKEVDFTPLAEADTATVRDADGQTRVIDFAVA
jgi:hypothetical protein